MTDPVILAVSLPYFSIMETAVPAQIPAHCGVPILAMTSVRNCVVDPFPGGRVGQTLTLRVNDSSVDSVIYQNAGDENKAAFFTITQDQFREGLNRVRCVVTNGSQNEGESEELRAFVHRNGPGRDPDGQPGDGVNLKLSFEVEEAAKYGVGPELAKRGVLFYLFYPLLRPFDTLSFFWGNHAFKYQVSEQEAAQVSPDHPLEVRVGEAEFIAAGDGKVACSYGPRDWIGNGASPEPYSRELSLYINMKGDWFDAPVLSPLTAGGDIDLGQLQGNPVSSQTHVRSPQWALGDIQRTICSYTDAEGKDVVLEVDQPMDSVPGFPQEKLSNSYFVGAKDRKVWVYYKQVRKGLELGRSYTTSAGVSGAFKPYEDFESTPEIKIFKVGESFLTDMFKVTLLTCPYVESYLHLFPGQVTGRFPHVQGKQLYPFVARDGDLYLTYELELREGTATRIKFRMRTGNITNVNQHMFVYFVDGGGVVLRTIRHNYNPSDNEREIEFDSALLVGIKAVRFSATGQYIVDYFERS